jgi:hypothetical protein
MQFDDKEQPVEMNFFVILPDLGRVLNGVMKIFHFGPVFLRIS